jgi:prepilin-type N-terminal cleavage/methylation domain-containing protein
MRRAGFTLMELLLSVTILVIITSIVYATFATVINSVEAARSVVSETRLRQHMIRCFETNVATVYVEQSFTDETYRFLGYSGDGSEGPRDALRFVSTAPVIGGISLPGDLKEVRLEVEDAPRDGESLTWETIGGDMDNPLVLRVTETPLIGAAIEGVDEATGHFAAPDGFEGPDWSVPIRTLSIRYFDGRDWLEEWDSHDQGRVPWAVEFKVNFAKPKEQLDAEKGKFNVNDDPDLMLVVTIPRGIGVPGDERGEEDLDDADGTSGGGDTDGGSPAGGDAGSGPGRVRPARPRDDDTPGQGVFRPAANGRRAPLTRREEARFARLLQRNQAGELLPPRQEARLDRLLARPLARREEARLARLLLRQQGADPLPPRQEARLEGLLARHVATVIRDGARANRASARQRRA